MNKRIIETNEEPCNCGSDLDRQPHVQHYETYDPNVHSLPEDAMAEAIENLLAAEALGVILQRRGGRRQRGGRK